MQFAFRTQSVGLGPKYVSKLDKREPYGDASVYKSVPGMNEE